MCAYRRTPIYNMIEAEASLLGRSDRAGRKFPIRFPDNALLEAIYFVGQAPGTHVGGLNPAVRVRPAARVWSEVRRSMGTTDWTKAEGTVPKAAAWCIARWGDFGVVFLALRLGLRRLGLLPWSPPSDWYSAISTFALINTCSMSLFATTLWKAAFGLDVIQLNGKKPHFIRAALRELYAITIGMACGIPVLAPLTGLLIGVKVLDGRRAPWDRLLRLQIQYRCGRRG